MKNNEESTRKRNSLIKNKESKKNKDCYPKVFFLINNIKKKKN
jgi:hypothetical protein